MTVDGYCANESKLGKQPVTNLFKPGTLPEYMVMEHLDYMIYSSIPLSVFGKCVPLIC